MNLCDWVSVTRRTVTGASDGLVSIAPTVVFSGVRCALSPVNAAQLAEPFGAGALRLDVSKERAFLYLPTYAATLPEPGHALSHYRFAVSSWSDAAWQAEAVLHTPDHARFLLWRITV
jgi:hypothetical protein